jgi:hypothetical protein
VTLSLCDVLWVPRGRGVEVPDPPREEDRQRHCGGHAPDQLGAAVLAAAYRGLRTGCTKTGTQSILLGCPLLLHL